MSVGMVGAARTGLERTRRPLGAGHERGGLDVRSPAADDLVTASATARR